jgi:PKD repeat protein
MVRRRSAHVVTKRIIVVAAVVGIVGCGLEKQAPPSLTGPSEFSMAVAVTASPDVISQDGVSSSAIQIVVRDANSQPMSGVSLRAETAVGETIVDFGTLSSRTISTGSDGRAQITYTAPPPPPATVTNDTIVTVLVTPVGTNFGNSLTRSVLIRLARPGVILPPNGTPVPKFFFSPTKPRVFDTVLFDASQSTDDGQIVSYRWNFGDGSAAEGVRVTHDFNLAGTYNVVLTVTDNQGLTASTPPTPVDVAVADKPVAAFSVSPTDPVLGTPVFVNAAASQPSPGFSITSYTWDFGDGVRFDGNSTASHSYAAAGTYVIVLTIRDSSGQTASVSNTVTVKP